MPLLGFAALIATGPSLPGSTISIVHLSGTSSNPTLVRASRRVTINRLSSTTLAIR